MHLINKINPINKMSTEVLENPEIETIVEVGENNRIILWNDDHNTFDHVINCMIKYLKKNIEEATNIAFTVHNKGKCTICDGERHNLVEHYNILTFEGLTVTLE